MYLYLTRDRILPQRSLPLHVQTLFLLIAENVHLSSDASILDNFRKVIMYL